MKKKQWNEFVEERMKEKKITQDDIAEAMGKTQGAIGHWLRGRRSANFDDVAKILHITDVEKVILNTIDGSIETFNDKFEVVGKSKEGIVPVVGEATMGRDDTVYLEEMRTGYIKIFSSDPNAYCLRCKGSSMEPRIHSGEFVLIEPGAMLCQGDDVLVRTIDGKYMIKTFERHNDE